MILVVRLLILTKVVNDIVLDGHITTLEACLHKETLVMLGIPSIPAIETC